MAAAYSHVIPTSHTDLLQKIVAWLVTQGWTQNMSQAEGTGWRAHVSKGGLFVNLRATPGNENIWTNGTYFVANQIGIAAYAGTGYSAASAWGAQAGGPVGSGHTYTVGSLMRLASSPASSAHFFDDGADNIAIVVEVSSGVFSHMGWGPSLNKCGTWTGGAYFFAPVNGYFGTLPTNLGTALCPGTHGADSYDTVFSTFVRADVDAFVSKWLCVGYGSIPYGGFTGKLAGSAISQVGGTQDPAMAVYGLSFQSRQVSVMNNQANLLPVRIFAARDVGGYSILGDIPNIFYTNATENGYAQASVHSVGADDIMIFPNFAVSKKA